MSPRFPPSPSPALWLLTGDKAGDNAQLLTLAEALGWPYRAIKLRYRATELISNRLLGPNRYGLDPARSDPLAPPWPALILTAGRRNEPIARWIQRQAPHPVKIVHLGRPWAPLDAFDLILTTPQYRLPVGGPIVQLKLPLHGVTSARLRAAAQQWRQLDDYPRPRLAVLLGGNSGPYTLYPAVAAALTRQAWGWAQRRGGSLWLSTSRRTPAAAVAAATEALAQIPPQQRHSYRFGQPQENPYWGYLALADAFLVTAESASMLAESCATQKPVYFIDPAEAAQALSGWQKCQGLRFNPIAFRLAMRYGPRRMMRDVTEIQRRLVAAGRASPWRGGEPEAANPPADAADEKSDLAIAVEAVRALGVGDPAQHR